MLRADEILTTAACGRSVGVSRSGEVLSDLLSDLAWLTMHLPVRKPGGHGDGHPPPDHLTHHRHTGSVTGALSRIPAPWTTGSIITIPPIRSTSASCTATCISR